MAVHKSVYINSVVTPKGRFSFPHLAKPDTEGQYADSRYKVTILIPKDADITKIKQAVMACAKAAWPGKKLKPSDLMLPLRDGDEKDNLDGYPGHWFITAKSKRPVTCVDIARENLAPEEVYGGCYGRCVLTAMSYEQKGKPGVTFLLDTVQKIEEGERFGKGGSGVSALDDGEFDEHVARGKAAAKDDNHDLDEDAEEPEEPESEDDDASAW